MLIATLIAAGRLDDRMIAAALGRLEGASMAGWVDAGHAADLEVRDAVEARAALEGWEGCDVVVQQSAQRARQMLVADMDSTVIGQECIDELADYAGFKPEVAAITERAMRGDLDFESALRERVALLRGLDAAALERCRIERVRLNPGAATLVRTMRARGAATLLVSGGFIDFVEPVAHEAGFEQFRANRLARDGDILSGAVEGAIVDSRVKASALVELRDQLGLESHAVLAVGDGANDLAMIEQAGFGVAFHAKPVLAAAADARLDYHGLDALLWAQGIPRRQWVI